MASDFPYVYPYSLGEALRRGEGEHHDSSFRLNVQCARDIEDAIRAHFHEADGSLGEQCAQSVLEKFGFKRVNFVLANSLEELRRSACKHLICDETYLWGRGTSVPPDGAYNRYYAVDTAVPLLEAFIVQTREAYQALGLFRAEHCVGGRDTQDYTGKVLVLSPDTLRECCWDSRNQLWLGEGGFGCGPHSAGRAVYATCLGDGEQTRWNRSDFIGVLDERYLPDWAREKLEALRGSKQAQDSSPAMGGISME